ncbi:hypothetical protein MUK42_23878 [Musa troglodytarum]|uniref:Uncharacterized protein n=1 Tax=Musa troglodytarum TaxID=320322 RepID=A0A9E7GEH8_9LILI|nr:hypothetical protein MUK42_23878 [Musa troglodytarum]
MASSLRLLCALLLLLCSIHGGRGQPCSTSDISVEQRKTGATVEGQAEYEVTVSNTCDCPQSKVMMLCYGLSSVEAVDPRAIKPVNAKLCAVAEGRPLSKGTPVKFKYAWKTPKDFPVVSTEIRC